MPINQRPRKRPATLTQEVGEHKVGTQFVTSHAGERQGNVVYHCYTTADRYVGLFSEKVLKMSAK